MTSITSNYSYPSLAAYLTNSNSNTNANSSDTSSTTPSLATLLDPNGSTNSGSDLGSLLQQTSSFRTYDLPVDGNGNTVIPTVAEMNAATTPDTQLTMANYVAQSVLMQSDASTKTGIATRISDITSQAQSVLQALASSATSLSNGTGLSAAQQKTTSSTLNAVNTTLSQIVNLLPKTDAATRTTLTSQISDLDQLAYNIAGLSGTAWNSVTGNSSNSIAGYSASAQSTSSISSSTSSLLNITI